MEFEKKSLLSKSFGSNSMLQPQFSVKKKFCAQGLIISEIHQNH